jgi:predicted TIM-barrel fold metal-dependent hydrolase
VATVFVECRAMWRATGPEAMRPVGETGFVAGVAAMGESGTYGPARICAGIVAHADLLLGDAVEEVLLAHHGAAGGRLRGIRHISASDPHPAVRSTSVLPPVGLLGDAKFRRGFARLAPNQLSFDAWLYHTQLEELIDLARAFPETTIVLDHVGGPLGAGPYAGRREEVAVAWRAAITALAACPNVVVKLGGLGMRVSGFDLHVQAQAPSSQHLARLWWPWIEPCIQAFGPDRCMFESNFPVDKSSCSYPILWNAFKRMTAGYSSAERDALFAGTAARTYSIGTSA